MNATPSSHNIEFILERTLKARERSSGEEKTVYLAIRKPNWTIPGEEASCPVLVTGLYYGKEQDIRSIDPFSALRTAIQYLDNLINGACGEYQFFWLDGEEYEPSS